MQNFRIFSPKMQIREHIFQNGDQMSYFCFWWSIKITKYVESYVFIYVFGYDEHNSIVIFALGLTIKTIIVFWG